MTSDKRPVTICGRNTVPALTIRLWWLRPSSTRFPRPYRCGPPACSFHRRDAAGTLIAEFPRTAYAALGALVSAKVQFEAGELATAKTQLEWVTQNARDPELQGIARIRLANVLVDEKAYDAALKTLDTKFEGEFESMSVGLRADILALQGKKAEARTAYKAAIDKIDATKGAGQRERIQMKLDALGESGT